MLWARPRRNCPKTGFLPGPALPGPTLRTSGIRRGPRGHLLRVWAQRKARNRSPGLESCADGPGPPRIRQTQLQPAMDIPGPRLHFLLDVIMGPKLGKTRARASRHTKEPQPGPVDSYAQVLDLQTPSRHGKSQTHCAQEEGSLTK